LRRRRVYRTNAGRATTNLNFVSSLVANGGNNDIRAVPVGNARLIF
jgi:hypothetical protein